ncbi:hypothetical protein SLEP1_g1315 [Rubroshorea leprosula]|uniref:Uncharacterized protein n=1 Tax=Rubroshorea leprosula TaxID=152421 RepID=A0AAV5HMZ9_9ROSI|nr:hypothetical protein SLEP1_g1315 [Rubroshorea leprosula]
MKLLNTSTGLENNEIEENTIKDTYRLPWIDILWVKC